MGNFGQMAQEESRRSATRLAQVMRSQTARLTTLVALRLSGDALGQGEQQADHSLGVACCNKVKRPLVAEIRIG